MRKLQLIGTVLLLLLILGLSASAVLSNPPPQEPPPPTEVRLGTEDDGRQIELKEGQLLVITLEANPSTGYRWEVKEVDENILHPVGEMEFQQESNLLGAPAKQIMRFQAVGAGQTALNLVYRRPWEKDVTPAKTFSIQVQAVGPFTGVGTAPITPTPSPPKSVPASAFPVPDQSQLGLPSSFNWCDAGGCTPVKNQGNCGSCWAFSTVGTLESKIKLQDTVEEDLSEQYLVSCNTDYWDCCGGWWAHDYHQWKIPPSESQAGAVMEAVFPYGSAAISCDSPEVSCSGPYAHTYQIDSWAFVGPEYGVPSVADIKQAIYDHGPVSVALCVGSAFQSYTTGVFETNESCFPFDINHAVVLVGWDDTDGAWILRNSWGATWGESGYMRIKYGTSNVGYSANYIFYSEFPNKLHLPLVMKNYSPGLPPGPFYSIADACVLEGYPTTNLGSASDMWAGYDDYLSPDGKIARSLVYFDVSAIPTATPIDSASLRVYLVGSYDFPGKTRTITAYRIGSGWSESSVIWNTQPSCAEAYGSASVTHGAWGWYSFNVTNLVRGWVNGTLPNYGVMLRGPEWSGYDSSWRAFSTREGPSPYMPQLVITYTGHAASGKAQVGGESPAIGEPAHIIIEALTGTPKSRLPSADLCPNQPPGEKCLALQQPSSW